MDPRDRTERIEPNLERIKRDILALSQLTSPTEPGYTRISFSEEDRKARGHVERLMKEEADLTVCIDPCGNLIGRREGKKEKPAILLGSHLDTVRGGGRFDGMSGVIAALEVARRLKEKGMRNDHPIEVVVFLAEEPSPFDMSTIGSRAMAGELSADLLGSLKDPTGRTLERAILEMGGDPARAEDARRSGDDVLAYLELHIEQGPSLFTRNVPIGVVTGIVGLLRGWIEVVGRSDHAGTTSMDIRKDALAAGSEVVLAVERICRRFAGLVGTVGKVEVSPNSTNVVPGRMMLSIDLRNLDEGLLLQADAVLRSEVAEIEKRRGIEIHCRAEITSRPVVFDDRMVKRMIRVCENFGIPHAELASGAGHDANHLAGIAPTGMIFIPSREGRSHCPEEWSEYEHLSLGTEVLGATFLGIDRNDGP